MKQRLIDANDVNLRDAIWKAKLDTREKIDELIENTPTIEAIPIEWIEKWSNNYCDNCQDNLIRCLLRTWRKENESN